MPYEPVTFVVFAGDVVMFALRKILNVHYQYPPQTTSHRKTFHTTLGEAVVVFRDRHSDEFAVMIADFPAFVAEDVETAVVYLQQFVSKNFKGRVPLMEFIAYCAFLVDLCVCCVENDKTDLVDDIVSETYDVYEDHVKSYFETVGGWLALLQIAKDYLGFVESMRLYGILVRTESENNGTIDSGNSETIISKGPATSAEIKVVPSTSRANLHKQVSEIDRRFFEDKMSITNTASETNGTTSNAISDNFSILKSIDRQEIIHAANSNLETEYIRAISRKTGCVDAEDLMSISSTCSDDISQIQRAITQVIASGGPIDSFATETCPPLTEYIQGITCGPTSTDAEDLMSIVSSWAEDSSDTTSLRTKCVFRTDGTSDIRNIRVNPGASVQERDIENKDIEDTDLENKDIEDTDLENIDIDIEIDRTIANVTSSSKDKDGFVVTNAQKNYKRQKRDSH